jgi:hypothetical protein
MDIKLNSSTEKFKWKDVAFTFRTRVNKYDRWKIDTAGVVYDGNKIQFEVWDFYELMIKLFVTGWEGVTEAGKDVPYSFESLKNLPDDDGEDIIMNLGKFIAETNGLIGKKVEDKEKLKNV